MLLSIDSLDTVGALKKALRADMPAVGSAHMSEAIAAGLGYRTQRSLLAALQGSTALTAGIDGQAFAARLAELAHVQAFANELLAAAIRVVPGALSGQDRDEVILAAVACAIQAARKDVDEDDEPTAFSLSIRHEGGREFSAEAAFREDYNMTIMVQDGADDESVRRLFAGDLGTIREMLSNYDDDWIENYQRYEDQGELLEHFDTWSSTFEVGQGRDRQVVEVKTEINDWCPDLVDRLMSGEERDLGENVRWWAEWGKRFHDARVERQELSADASRAALAEVEEAVLPTDGFEEDVMALAEGNTILRRHAHNARRLAELEQREPSFDPGIRVHGRAVQVWPEAVAVTRYDSVGEVTGCEIYDIDDETFERIGDRLHALGQWMHDVEAVRVILDVVEGGFANATAFGPR